MSTDPEIALAGVYYHFHTWGKHGGWKKGWLSNLHLHRRTLDLSSVPPDGSHMLPKNGGAAKRSVQPTPCSWPITNGLPLAVATPQAGNQHATFEWAHVFAELCDLLEAAALRLDGLFLNADKAFDISSLRQACAQRGLETNMPRNRRSAD